MAKIPKRAKRIKGHFDKEKFLLFKASAEPDRTRLRNELILENMPYVVYKASQFHANWSELDLDEFVNAGAIVLVTALEKYSPAKGAFTSYAALWLRMAFLLVIQDAKDIIVPRQFCPASKDVGTALQKATAEGRELTMDDVREAARAAGKRKSQINGYPDFIFSFEGIWNDKARTAMGGSSTGNGNREERSVLPPSPQNTAEEYENAEERATLDAAMLACSDEQRRVLKKHYYDEVPLTAAETEILEEALDELRDHF